MAKSSGIIPFPSPKQLPEGKRVLMVDAETGLRSELRDMLTAAGCDVVLAEGGAQATRFWRERGADLLILDLSRPEMDGIETLLDLRAYSPGIPVIAVAAGRTSRQLDLLQDAGLLSAVATIETPFEDQAMMELVGHALVGEPYTDWRTRRRTSATSFRATPWRVRSRVALTTRWPAPISASPKSHPRPRPLGEREFQPDRVPIDKPIRSTGPAARHLPA